MSPAAINVRIADLPEIKAALKAAAEKVEAVQALADFALEVLAVGGNGEGWTITDAVNALRFAVEQEGVGPRWTAAVSGRDVARLRSFVGNLPIFNAPHPPSLTEGEP